MTVDEPLLMRQRQDDLEAIERVLSHQKWGETELRRATEPLTNRPDRIEELLRRARDPTHGPGRGPDMPARPVLSLALARWSG